MTFVAQFVKFRSQDNRPIPVSLPVQVVAQSADQAMAKLKRLTETNRWPEFADAVRLFEDGREIDSFIPALEAA